MYSKPHKNWSGVLKIIHSQVSTKKIIRLELTCGCDVTSWTQHKCFRVIPIVEQADAAYANAYGADMPRGLTAFDEQSVVGRRQVITYFF